MSTVGIVWKGRGRRLLGTEDGLSQDYEWPGPGATVEAPHEDAAKIMLLGKRDEFGYEDPADARRIDAEADAMTAPAEEDVEPAGDELQTEEEDEPELKPPSEMTVDEALDYAATLDPDDLVAFWQMEAQRTKPRSTLLDALQSMMEQVED